MVYTPTAEVVDAFEQICLGFQSLITISDRDDEVHNALPSKYPFTASLDEWYFEDFLGWRDAVLDKLAEPEDLHEYRNWRDIDRAVQKRAVDAVIALCPGSVKHAEVPRYAEVSPFLSCVNCHQRVDGPKLRR
jgi:hypothetical protein